MPISGWASWQTSTSTSAADGATSCSAPSPRLSPPSERDALVADLAAAGVPVAPVLDRQEMLASGPFPPFPIRLSLPATAGAVPALDQHHGEGFCDRT